MKPETATKRKERTAFYEPEVELLRDGAGPNQRPIDMVRLLAQ